jgi:predicted enzyme related to lactoylglutathione lyase
MTTPAVAWFEVTGKDGAALQNFYGKLFDWQINDAGDGSGYGLVAAAPQGLYSSPGSHSKNGRGPAGWPGCP